MADITRLSQLRDVHLLVWGGGIEGRSVVERALSQNCTVTLVSDAPDTDSRIQTLAHEHGLAIVGANALSTINADFLVRSPGVSKYRAEIAALADRGIHSSNLLALWLADQDPDRIIGVTGTKGKSTTASLIASFLRITGNKVALAGNIGVAVTDVPDDAEIVVVEISSYQASDCTISPSIGVLTSLDQDHLQWHGSVDRYHRDKLNAFAHPQLHTFICDPDDTYVMSKTSAIGLTPAPQQQDIFTAESIISAAKDNPNHINVTSGPLMHNIRLAIAAAIAYDSSLNSIQVEEVIRTFEPLPSRQKVVAVRNGVTYIDDALASNPYGVIAALDSFANNDVVLIVGGYDRGVDYAPLISRLQKSSNVKAIVALGSKDDSIAQQFSSTPLNVQIVGSQSVADAVARARSVASFGSYVIFSPGAPTPTEIGTYIDRSAAYIAAIG